MQLASHNILNPKIRPEFDRLISNLSDGDTIVTTKLIRLSPSLDDLTNTLNKLKSKKILFQVVDDNIL